jgi:hypothetical protein
MEVHFTSLMADVVSRKTDDTAPYQENLFENV